MLTTVAAATIAACSWAEPGRDPFMGDVVAAVDRYRDIPAAARDALKARMLAHQYDDLALITREGIAGEHEYTDLRDMHFGAGRLCRSPSRALWSARHAERGLVYCEAEHCLIVPTVCRNVSRVTRAARTTQPPPEVPAPPIEIPGGTGGLSFAELALDDVERPPAMRLRATSYAEPIPEPGSVALMLVGLLAIGAYMYVKRVNRLYDQARSMTWVFLTKGR